METYLTDVTHPRSLEPWRHCHIVADKTIVKSAADGTEDFLFSKD